MPHQESSQNEKLFYGATSASVIFGSSLLWSWWDLAFYSGIFFNWQPGAQGLIVPAFVVGMLTAGATLLLFAIKAKLVSPLLYRGKRRQIMVGAIALLASGGSIASAQLNLLPLALISSAVNGCCLAVLLALWGTLWSERGASSSIIVTSLAIPLGIAIDGIVLVAFRPLAASVALCLFPLASIFVYLFFARAKADSAPYERRRLTKAGAPTSSSPIRSEIFGISLLLLVGLAVGELAFNFMNYHFAYDAMAPDQGLAFNYSFHLARAAGALTCFIFVGLLHVPYKRFFWVGIMTMCAAFAIAPFLEAVGLPPYVCNYINQACFAIVAIFEISVFCEISFARQTYPLESIGFGMVFITGFIVPGLLIGVFVAQLNLSVSQYGLIVAVAGYAVILGLWAAVSEGQRYLDPETGVAAGVRLSTEVEQQNAQRQLEHRQQLIEKGGLTDREQTVLDELLMGRHTLYIASKLSISENTVKTHVQNIYKKLGVHNKNELIDLFNAIDSHEIVAVASPVPTVTEEDARALAKHRSMSETIEQLASRAGLTAREQEVFALLARGYRHKEIARKLVISPSTVHSHVNNVYAKLGVHSQDELSELVSDHRERNAED